MVVIAGRAKPIVMVVEDVDEDRRRLADALWASGYDVIEVTSGPAAIELLERGARPAVIVLNIGLAKSGGWELWDHRQARQELRTIPFVMLSTFSQQGSIGDAVIVRKPFDDDDVLREIRALTA